MKWDVRDVRDVRCRLVEKGCREGKGEAFSAFVLWNRIGLYRWGFGVRREIMVQGFMKFSTLHVIFSERKVLRQARNLS
jgi:hypothetical protein